MILIPENINNITQQLVESLQQLKSDLEITVNSSKITYIKRTIKNPKTRKEHNFEPYNIAKYNNKFISKVIEKLEIALGNTLIIEEIKISELTPDTFSNLKTKFPINYCYYQLEKHLNIQTLYSKDSTKVFDKTTIQLLEPFIGKTNTTFHSKTVYRIFKAFENCHKLLLDSTMNIITTNSIGRLTNSQFQELQQQINNTVLNHYSNLEFNEEINFDFDRRNTSGNCKDSLREDPKQWVDFSSASEKEYINTHNNQELKNNLYRNSKKESLQYNKTHERLIAIKMGYQQLNITRKLSHNIVDLKTALGGDMSKKMMPKSAFYGPAGGFFSQKKRVVLGNIEHLGDKKDVFLCKPGPGSMYLNLESEFSSGEDNIVIKGIDSRSFLGSAANTSKAKRVNTGVVLGSPLGFLNYNIDDDEIIIKTPVEVSVKKLFALDINFLAVEGKSVTAKTQLVRKIFSTINGFEKATTLSKFEGIIQSTFTFKENMNKTTLLAREKEININSNLKKQGICSDWAVVIKEIPIDMPKEMIVTTVSEFEGCDKIHQIGAGKATDIKMVIPYWKEFMRTFAHDLGILLEEAGEKTCVINCSLEIDNWTYCAVVGFESENELESAFCIKPIFGNVKLSWARLDLVQCERCGKFRHLALECNVSDTLVSVLSEKNFKKNASDIKTWTQVVLFAGLSGGSHFSSGSSSGLSFSGVLNSNSNSSLASANNSSLSVFDILEKLSCIELVPTVLLFSVPPSAIPTSLVSHLDVDMALDNVTLTSAPSFSASVNVVYDSSSSFSKVLTFKVGKLESKIVAFEVLIGSVLERLNHLYSGLVFISGLDFGYLGLGVAIIMDAFLAKHMCGVSEVSGQLISVKLLFKNKLSVIVLGLYVGATLEKRLAYSHIINSMVVKALNSSIFVVFGGDFNENNSGHSYIEAFADNKDQMIKSVLEKPFKKVILNYLVNNGDLVLDPNLVKSKVDSIMENWTRKYTVKSSVPSHWQEQFSHLNYVDNSAFSGMIKHINFDEFSSVVKDLFDGKAAGLSSISNEI
ncbi:hypothetical protein G9A89_023235 [Geosiphon pyriformis]|nr:hypothetical protein G9A89_023235 [Geosiphon pyriformis]